MRISKSSFSVLIKISIFICIIYLNTVRIFFFLFFVVFFLGVFFFFLVFFLGFFFSFFVFALFCLLLFSIGSELTKQVLILMFPLANELEFLGSLIPRN